MSSLAETVLNSIARRDYSLMRKVQKWPAPKWIRLWMICATRGGDGWLWYIMGAFLLIFGGAQEMLVAAESGFAAGTGIILFLGLKRATGRRRPCAVEPSCWSKLLPPDQFSFPSGHTITAFAVCTPIVLQYPHAAPGILFCAVSIAASRIILGMHFLSDVVAGGAIGWMLGLAVRQLF
jgi:undecaprenyl-diphosphatase